MKKVEVGWTDYLPQVMRSLQEPGLLLASSVPGRPPNAMAIGWAVCGIMWGKPVMVVLVRPSRYTFGLIEEAGEFSVNVPGPGMGEVVRYFGSVSGRDTNKFKEKGLSAVPGVSVKVPIVSECGLNYECRVVHKNDVIPEGLSPEITQTCYSAGNYHRLFFGEIVCVLADKEALTRI